MNIAGFYSLGRKKMINGLRFIVGNGCNYNCFFCHHEGYTKNSSTKYDEKKIEQIYIFAKKNRIKDISITGGEPFLYWEKLKCLLKYFGNDEFRITLNTNLIFTDRYIDYLKKVPNIEYHVNFSSIQSEIHENIINANYLEKLILNLNLLKKYNLKVCLNIPVLNNINSLELIDMLEYANKMDFLARFLVLLPTDIEHKKYFMDVEEIMNVIPDSKLIKKYSYGRYDVSSSLGNYEIVKCLCIDHECDLCRDTTYIHLTPELNIRLCMESDDEYEIDFSNIVTIEKDFKDAVRRLKK